MSNQLAIVETSIDYWRAQMGYLECDFGSNHDLKVQNLENRRLELLTPCLQSRCSPN